EYMWCPAFDEGSLGGGESQEPQNAACRHCEWATTNQDIRHTLTVNWVYEIRHGSDSGGLQQFFSGWQLSGLMQAGPGRPLTITVNRATTDLPDGNNRNQRPDVVPGVDPYPA